MLHPHTIRFAGTAVIGAATAVAGLAIGIATSAANAAIERAAQKQEAKRATAAEQLGGDNVEQFPQVA